MLVPSYAFAAGAITPELIANFFYRVLVFAVFLGILYKFLRKPILDALVNRTANIEQALNSAEKAKQEAQEKVREYEEKSRQLEKELEEMKANVLAAAEKERELIMADATRAVDRLKESAIAKINNETVQAKLAIKREIVADVFAEAEKLITNEMKGAEAKAVLNGYISRIGE